MNYYLPKQIWTMQEFGLWVAYGFYEEYGGAPTAGVVVVEVDGEYTHEFTTVQVHYFLEEEYATYEDYYGFVEKPFTVEQLMRRLREILDE